MHGKHRGATTGLKTKNFAEALRTARQKQHRVLLVLSGTHAWCKEYASVWYGNATQRFWIGDAADHPEAITIAKAKQVLGSEYAMAVLDAHAGLSPDCLAAVCGTVVGDGGVLMILTPEWNQWGNAPDTDYARLASYPHDSANLSAHFLARLRTALENFSESSAVCFHWREEEDNDEFLSSIVVPQSVKKQRTTAIPTAEQQHCLQQLQAHNGISVLLADRGCGKSATLGFAARDWMEQGESVLLVAPSRAAAASVFRYAGNDLAFSSPDNLLADKNATADILLIDEAAAIPLPMLLALLERFPHAVLATTADGYEGTGQGFVLRFLHELDKQFPAWQRLTLDAPIRWAKNDPLQQWLYDTLLLNAQAPVFKEVDINVSSVIFESISQAQLAQDEVLLNEIYGLLRSAHYRTTPDDLRFLLDAPSVSIYRLVLQGRTLAVALLVEEGEIDTAMASEIAAGKRRPRGHMLVQSLAIHLQQPQFLQQRVARVVRIAVHPQFQAQGLGSQLLQEIVQRKKEEGVSAVGSSFSASPEVVRFWQKNGFELLRVGHRRQAASAEPSALVLMTFDN